MPRILVFDVNETLLDLTVLEPHFERVFGDKTMLREWFNQVIQFAEALTLAGDYRNFGEVARAALEMTAEAHRVRLSPEDAQEIMGSMRNLPAHRGSAPSSEPLEERGFSNGRADQLAPSRRGRPDEANQPAGVPGA